MEKITGRSRNEEWKVQALHALYRENGTWYHVLKKFPGALFDKHGYVLFKSEEDYRKCPSALMGEAKNWMNVPEGISSLPNYIRVK